MSLVAADAFSQQPAPGDKPAGDKPAAAPSDDPPLTPPPGTPGSTRSEEEPGLTPPPGTPGSTASGKKPKGPKSKLSSSAFPPPPPPSEPQSFRPIPSEGYRVSISSRTFLRLFQTKYLTGSFTPEDQQTEVPIYEYASLRVDDVNAPWQKHAIGVRLSAWGVLNTIEPAEGNRVSGDLTAANVRSELGPAYVTLGRQVATGGAARFTRFDGITTGLRFKNGIGADAYTGFSVIPRFGSRPEYILLGSRADSLLRNPAALPSASPTSYWLGGGRLSYSAYNVGSIGASIHQERDRGELGRRWAALDGNLSPATFLTFGGQTSFDLISYKLADARGYADVLPPGPVSATLDFLRTDPSAFLSRTSVLSVFSMDTFTEAGGELTWKALRNLSVAGSAHHEWFTDSTSGNRFGGTVRASFGARKALVTQVRYQRVVEPISGYHSVRGSVSYLLPIHVTATAELYEYLYDQAIRGVDSSTVGSGTVEYAAPGRPWRVMLGGFASQTPFAKLETQGIARFSYDIDLPGGAR
ncbi:MAG: hypothetical protein HY898_12030 [Deltaproteobacteria bacterium]|nr:hypothetical protein [Deltaproteobacteria bacterium]